MDVRNCKNCGRLFNYVGGPPICTACSKDLEEKFEQVKEYIYNNPKVGIQIVAEENDVSVQQIKKWIREERLSFSDDSDIGLECENCGVMIRTGRFCKNCKSKMQDKLTGLYKEPVKEVTKKEHSKERMRFLDK